MRKKLNTVNQRQQRITSTNLKKLCFVGSLPCIKETSDDPETEDLNFCVPISLFFKVFRLAHCELSGHVGLDKTLNIKQFVFWPGLYKWIENIIADCLDCQRNKHKRKDFHEAPLEKWTGTVPFPFHTFHIDDKEPLNPPSDGKPHCLIIVDSFSRFIEVYPVRTTIDADTNQAFEKCNLSCGNPQKLDYEKGSSFKNQDFASYIHKLGITHAPRTAFSPWTNGKIEVKNKHLGALFRILWIRP